MKCPVDDTELVMSDRQGIEIDYCPKCRGVWLDRGELDKIIEKSMAAEATAAARPDPERYRDGRHHGGGRPHRKKKESFLSELFDF